MIITPGTFVRLKHDPSRAGVLENGEKYTAGAQMVEVRFADGQVKWLPYSALEPVPSASENLWDRFTAGRFVEPDWLRRTLTRQRVTGRLSEMVYSTEATETDFYAYQFKPVIKLMNSPTDALLIAARRWSSGSIMAGTRPALRRVCGSSKSRDRGPYRYPTSVAGPTLRKQNRWVRRTAEESYRASVDQRDLGRRAKGHKP